MSQYRSGHSTVKTDCDELRDLLPAYSIGATTPEETARVQELLPRCPDVAEEMADFVALAEDMALTVEPVQPAPHLHDKLMAAAIAEKAANKPQSESAGKATSSSQTIPFPTTEATGPQMLPRSRWTAWLIAAAASILLIASNAFWVYQFSETSDELVRTNQELTQANEELAQISENLVQAEGSYEQVNQDLTVAQADLTQVSEKVASMTWENSTLLRLIGGGGDVRTFALHSTTDQSHTATVLWNQQHHEGVLYTNVLPELGAEQAYQLWLINDSGPISAGVFQPGQDDDSFYTFESAEGLSAFNAIAISVEPAGGSETPTSDPIAVGET